MRLLRIVLSSSLILAAVAPAFGYMHARRGPTSSSMFKKKSLSKSASHSGRTLGPRAMDSERATQIQEALIKNGYLTGAPTGRWDAESEAAMQKLQGSKGWQTKLTPDSRALILLGLGPKTDVETSASPASNETSSLTSGAGFSQ